MKSIAIDAEVLAGKRFEYQEDMSLVEDLDLMELTPGKDLNWLEDIHLLEEDDTPAVFDRNSNSFIKIYFDIPEGREDEIARKVLMKHLISGNSYGIQPGWPTRSRWATTGPPRCSRAGSPQRTRARPDARVVNAPPALRVGGVLCTQPEVPKHVAQTLATGHPPREAHP